MRKPRSKLAETCPWSQNLHLLTPSSAFSVSHSNCLLFGEEPVPPQADTDRAAVVEGILRLTSMAAGHLLEPSNSEQKLGGVEGPSTVEGLQKTDCFMLN